MDPENEVRKPAVRFQPSAHKGMQRGFHKILNAVTPTLGPYPRMVAYRADVSTRSPELLDDGGTIVRRIIQIQDRREDVGAMFVRQMLWQLNQRVGDGTATAGVLFQTIFDEGLRFLAAGNNAMLLRRHLEAGMVLIDQELGRQTIHFSHRNRKEKFAQVAHSICYDPPMAELLGEIFDIIGEYGVLDIRSGSGRELEREYVEGMYWKGKLLSRQMITDPGRSRADVEDAFVLISDCTVEDPRDLLPVVTAAVQAKGKAMFIVAKKLSDVTIHLLTRKETKDKLHIIAAEIPGSTLTEQAAALQDLAILTGGRPIVSKGGQTLRDAKVEDLGRVRRAWADSRNFGISGGHGDRRKLREYIAQLRQAYPHLEDADKRKSVLQRIGKLLGGSATLWVGGNTRSEVDARKELADRTARAMRGAVLDGVLPGGGVALLNCRPALQKRLEQSASLPERAAYNILLKAVEAPIRTLLANAGYEPSSILGDIFRNGDGCGFDLQTGQIANMTEAGIFDVASVQRDAVRTAISSAALALTVDVVVHRKKPTVSFEP